MSRQCQGRIALSRSIRTIIALGVIGAAGSAPAAQLMDVEDAQDAQDTQDATDSPKEVTSLDQIVVTAQRRTQNLQEVPIAVSVISAKTLDTLRVQDVADVGRLVPSLTVTRSGKAPTIFIRGIGNNSFSPGQEQNIATYVDGVYYPSMSANVFSFDNLERIEVLKGPQGTLFGRNSTGGVIQIVTQDPTQEAYGRVGATHGNYDYRQASAFVSGGLSDNLAANVAIRWSDQGDGWGTNIFNGEDVNLGRDYSARTKFVYTPGESTKISAGGFYSRTVQDFGSSRQMLPGTPMLPPSFGSIRFSGSIYDRNANYPSVDTTTQWGANVKVDHELNFANFVSISAYHVTEVSSLADIDQSPIDRTHVIWQDRTRSLSQEFQLQSLPEQPVQWVAGLYYFTADAGNIPQRQAGDLMAAFGGWRDIWGEQNTDSYALFGQTTFPLFDDATELTLGARYTTDDKSFKGRIETAAAGVTTRTRDQADWQNVTYRIALDRRFADNVMGYASIGTGFKSGVYNVVNITAAPAQPEKLTSYELGLKTDFYDSRLRLNSSLFYYDYTDLQLLRLVGATTTIQNAADAELYGLEIEARAVPMEGLTLNLGLSLIHSEYVDFPDAVANTPGANGLGVTRVFDASGNRLQRTPGSTLNFGVDYAWHTDAGEFGIGASIYRNGGFYWEPENRLEQDAYTLVDAGFRWRSSRNGLGVQLWAKNLLDEEYYAYVTSSSGAPDTGAPGAPRTYGVSISYDF